MIYFTSDTHFGHANIIKWHRKKFKTIQGMEDALVNRWNIKVKPDDTVIVVGDFAFLNSTERARVLSRLNGFKVLVQGNHDSGQKCPKGFDLMVQEMTMNIAGQYVSIKHYPLRWSGWKKLWATITFAHKPRFLNRMPINKGQWHIHGHTHSSVKFDDKQIHVGCEAWNCTPVSIKQIAAYIQQYEAKGE